VTKAVVVGGGVIGACCALHLREAGVANVALLESAEALGAQTTSGGAGFVGYGEGALETVLTDYATAFYSQIQEEAGADLGVRQCGQLFPAISEAGEGALRRLCQRHSEFYEAHWLGPVETEEAAQILAPGKVRGALWQPRAQVVPTVRMIQELARRLPAIGVEVRLGCAATGVQRSADRVVGVLTSDGAIPADVVVNAAGAWAHSLAARDGVSVGAVPLAESRFVTEPSPQPVSDRLPMMLLFERDLLYLRPELGGLLVGAVERSVPESSRPSLESPPDVGDLPAEAAEAHERLARSCADLIPRLGELRPKTRAGGLPTFTPDGRHVLGEAPELAGYYVVAGCNESGVTHAPGLARVLAELVTTGTTKDDISAYRVGRHEGLSDRELSEGATATYLARHSIWR
jgi:glycine/D-amino acid oxidase-like deaminating enzyme